MKNLIKLYKRTLADLTHRKTRSDKIKIALVYASLDIITILVFNIWNQPLEAFIVSMAIGFIGSLFTILP